MAVCRCGGFLDICLWTLDICLWTLIVCLRISGECPEVLDIFQKIFRHMFTGADQIFIGADLCLLAPNECLGRRACIYECRRLFRILNIYWRRVHIHKMYEFCKNAFLMRLKPCTCLSACYTTKAANLSQCAHLP